MAMKFTMVIVLIFLCSFVPGQEGTCTPFPEAPACGCTLSDGKTIDLRGVGNSSGVPVFAGKGQKYSFLYNPCYPFSTHNGCVDVAACQLDGFAGRDLSVGIQKIVNFEVVNGDILISYIGGTSGRTTEVTLKCKIGAPTFVFDGELPLNNYRFTLSSECGCPGACGQGEDKKDSDPGML